VLKDPQPVGKAIARTAALGQYPEPVAFQGRSRGTDRFRSFNPFQNLDDLPFFETVGTTGVVFRFVPDRKPVLYGFRIGGGVFGKIGGIFLRRSLAPEKFQTGQGNHGGLLTGSLVFIRNIRDPCLFYIGTEMNGKHSPRRYLRIINSPQQNSPANDLS